MTRIALVAATLTALATPCLLPAQSPTTTPPAAEKEDPLSRILAGGEPRNPAELLLMQEHVQALLDELLESTVSLGGGATGVVVEGGYVLTAGHVSRTNGRKLKMTLHDGRRIDGETLGANRRTDTGLIRILTEGEFPARPMGKSGDLERGDWCMMLGHPSGTKQGRSAPARLGRVLRVPERGYLVTDCTMQSGDSGGPLVDMDGRVIGINSRISNNLAENMHVPIDAFHDEWDKLVAGEVVQAPSRGRGRRGQTPMGFGVPISWEDDAATVGEVPEDSAAARAGLRAGDIITKVGDREIDGQGAFRRSLRRRRVGDEVKVVVQRMKETVELTLEVQREER